MKLIRLEKIIDQKTFLIGAMTSRRDFIKATSLTGVGLTILPSGVLFSKQKEEKVRIGLIGVGLRGQNHLDLFLRRDDVEVVSICDVQQRMMDMTKDMIKKSDRAMPQTILDGPYGYRKMLENKDIDAVIISTPWEWHTIMCLDAMNAGKYTACEVMTGATVEECWQLVRTSERTGMPLMMLENVATGGM
ncbi:MAG: Gfo/Idh/MocA family oxidoreductase [Cyclobacteriaceae bacterium]